jgi:hypothetical protein
MATINSEEIHAQRAQLRDVNEHIVRLTTGDENVTLLCECASGYCIENVSMRRGEFLAIQSRDCLVLAPGHRI